MVERIVGIGLVKQIDQTINDCIDIQDGSPILSQNVQTDLALQINVGMVNVRLALDLGWRVGVVSRDVEDELVCGALPVTGIGSY